VVRQAASRSSDRRIQVSIVELRVEKLTAAAAGTRGIHTGHVMATLEMRPLSPPPFLPLRFLTLAPTPTLPRPCESFTGRTSRPSSLVRISPSGGAYASAPASPRERSPVGPAAPRPSTADAPGPSNDDERRGMTRSGAGMRASREGVSSRVLSPASVRLLQRNPSRLWRVSSNPAYTEDEEDDVEDPRSPGAAAGS
jgi:hypothetical protein